jgi:hypothetical protein
MDAFDLDFMKLSSLFSLKKRILSAMESPHQSKSFDCTIKSFLIFDGASCSAFLSDKVALSLFQKGTSLMSFSELVKLDQQLSESIKRRVQGDRKSKIT